MEKQWKWVKLSEATAAAEKESLAMDAGGAAKNTVTIAGHSLESREHREKPTDVINDIGSWYSVWLMAIARAWSDEGFKKRLLEDPRRALKDDLQYVYPEDIILTIKDATGVNNSGWTHNGANGSWKVPPSEVTLWMPPKPEKLEDQAVALGSYSFTSQTYPFTCCC
jgi:ribosomally synthesized peptide (two-chain TOMM family)